MVLLKLWVGGKLGVPFKLQLVPQGTSHVASGKSSPLWSCMGECRSAFDSLQGNRASFHVGGEVRISCCFSSCSGRLGFISSCDGGLRESITLPQGSLPPFKLHKAPQDSYQVSAGETGFISS